MATDETPKSNKPKLADRIVADLAATVEAEKKKAELAAKIAQEEEEARQEHVERLAALEDEKAYAMLGVMGRAAKTFEFIGPLLAGGQAAIHLLSFLGVGAFANWLLQYWFPVTRLVWTWILSKLHLPQVTDPEKDALTTVAFFLPVGIWAIFVRLFRYDRRSVTRKKIAALRGPAIFVGLVFVLILGQQIVWDVLRIFTTQFALFTDGEVFYSLPDYMKYALLVAVCAAAIFVPTVFGSDDWLNDPDNAGNVRLIAYWSIIFYTAVGIIVPAMLVVSGEGPIRTVCMLLTLMFLAIGSYYTPARLIGSFGVMIVIVVASLVFEFGTSIVAVVEGTVDASNASNNAR